MIPLEYLTDGTRYIIKIIKGSELSGARARLESDEIR
jgi:hypothetical protein